MNSIVYRWAAAGLAAWLGLMVIAPSNAEVEFEQDHSLGVDEAAYRVNPGDILQISVWHEPDLQTEVVVRPDGGFSIPLVGDVLAVNKTVAALGEEIRQRLVRYVPDALVNVAVKQAIGNKIYVIGMVNRPGEYIVNRDVDVMQALSMAAGMTKFAEPEKIKILRRTALGKQVIAFDYEQVAAGEQLEQNIVLMAGDVVVVP